MNDHSPQTADARPTLSDRKQAIRDRADLQAPERERWIARNAYSYREHHRYLRFLVPKGLKILELGCGIGHTLAALEPAKGVGVDFSSAMVDIARKKHPHLDFIVGDVEDPQFLASLDHPFDVILLSDTIGELEDVESTLKAIRGFCTPDTRLVIAYYSNFWEPILRTAEMLGQAMPHGQQNWLSTQDTMGILSLAGFDVVKRDWRQLIPKSLLGIGPLLNRYIGTLPILRRMCLRSYIVARSGATKAADCSATVVIPCKNERGNVEPAVRRLPEFSDDLEILFVEGGSQDGTREEIERVIEAFPERDIKLIIQDEKGKGNAVRSAFAAARGDILIILDGDLTVPPEWVPRFYEVLRDGHGEFANGSRLVYPMQEQAMRFLNHIANRTFALLFSWLLNQPLTDTLCGTKVLWRRHYKRIEANRAYFGEFDPFGDFDLLFGASKLNLKIVEVPVRYASRSYGETQISRFQHGWLLLRMVLFAYKKLKAF
jgi:SAM-dependent methyltransferase